MPFNSIPFLIFLLAVFAAFCWSKERFRLHILVIASLLFYAYSGIISIVFVLLVSLVLFIYSHYQVRSPNAYILSIGLILFLLLSAKWLPLLGGHLNIPHLDRSFLLLAAPIGISFYSLQAIGYIVDVRDQRIAPKKDAIRLTAFLTFFPQALAGPIHRANQLMPQLYKFPLPSFSAVVSGVKTMLWGYFCKLIVADKIALIVDPVLANPENENGMSLALSSVLYAHQIYFDFFGYTLIAIGMASLFGITLNENFNRPYSANSFKEFWRRWHISLSTWLRDYVYLRLGGKHNTLVNYCFILILTFSLSGLWHGLTPNFILWGLIHATFYIGESLLDKQFVGCKISNHIILRVAKKVLFFTLLTFSWLVFRTTDLAQLWFTVAKIVKVEAWSIKSLSPYLNNVYFAFLLLVAGIVFINVNKLVRMIIITQPENARERGIEGLYVICCLLLIVIFGDLGTQEFLYFNF